MPSKPRTPGKPTFYLDQSTLSDAYRVESPEHRPLRRWIERVGSEANLCVSIAHVLEIAYWGDEAAADGLARWLDTLPLVWAYPSNRISEMEADRLLERAAGVIDPAPVEPFAPDIPWPCHTVLEWVRESRNRDTPEREVMRDAALRFYADEARAQREGISDAERRERLDANRRRGLTKIAETAYGRRMQADPAYAAAGVSLERCAARFVELYRSDPAAMRTDKVHWGFARGHRATAVRRTPGSRKWGENDSMFCDREHAAVGAAHCDVFTADGTVAGFVSRVRCSFGYDPPLTARGDPAAFVRDLMATWP